MVSFFYLRPTILRSSFEKVPQAFSNYSSLKVFEAHIGEYIMQNTLKIKDYTNAIIVLQISLQRKLGSS